MPFRAFHAFRAFSAHPQVFDTATGKHLAPPEIHFVLLSLELRGTAREFATHFPDLLATDRAAHASHTEETTMAVDLEQLQV